MKTLILVSLTAAFGLTSLAAPAAPEEATTGSRIKRLETVVSKTVADKPAVTGTTTGSRIKRLENLAIYTDARKAPVDTGEPVDAEVAALLAEAEAAEAID